MRTYFIAWADRLVAITPECMGYRSLIALIALAVLVALVNRMALSHGVALVVAAAAISAACNALRIASILAVALVAPDFAYGLWHDLAGYLVFVVAMMTLFSVADLLNNENGGKRNGRE